jgi:plastocyanin
MQNKIFIIITYMKKSIRSKSRIMPGAIILVIIFIISGSCSKSSNTNVTPGPNEVIIQNFAFNPGTISVTTGTTVTWTNKDAVTHTVTSNTAGLFDSGNIAPNGTYTHTFSTAGSYPYHCTIHPYMTGTVIVN